jgi:dephospho-CoA kinase
LILTVGLTGGIATGKSTVARTLAALGCVTIDADAVVGRLYRPGQAGHEALVRQYGRDILSADGEIDRPKVAAIAFASAEATKQLNALIHPLVLEEEHRIIEAESRRFPDRDRIVVVEATLLLESGGKSRYDKVVVVDTEPALQVERAVKRGMRQDDVERRFARQMPRDERIALADYVIRNDGDVRALEVETHRIYGNLREDLEAKKKNPPSR